MSVWPSTLKSAAATSGPEQMFGSAPASEKLPEPLFIRGITPPQPVTVFPPALATMSAEPLPVRSALWSQEVLV